MQKREHSLFWGVFFASQIVFLFKVVINVSLILLSCQTYWILLWLVPDIADLAGKYQHLLSADPDSKYDRVIEINLSEVRNAFTDIANQSCKNLFKLCLCVVDKSVRIKLHVSLETQNFPEIW